MKTNKTLISLCEAAIMIALSIALSYIEIPIGMQGGSISFTMIPIIIYSLKYGFVKGVTVGLAFGTLKFFLGGKAFNLVSIIFDYSVAYAAVGFAGLFKSSFSDDNKGLTLRGISAAFAGGFVRFVIHFISGVTVYAEYAENTYFGIATPNEIIYSLVYNAVYMLPSILIAMILVPILIITLKRFIVKRV